MKNSVGTSKKGKMADNEMYIQKGRASIVLLQTPYCFFPPISLDASDITESAEFHNL